MREITRQRRALRFGENSAQFRLHPSSFLWYCLRLTLRFLPPRLPTSDILAFFPRRLWLTSPTLFFRQRLRTSRSGEFFLTIYNKFSQSPVMEVCFGFLRNYESFVGRRKGSERNYEWRTFRRMNFSWANCYNYHDDEKLLLGSSILDTTFYKLYMLEHQEKL